MVRPGRRELKSFRHFPLGNAGARTGVVTRGEYGDKITPTARIGGPQVTDTQPTPATDERDERLLCGLVYVLYLLGPANGLTVLVGALIALLRKDKAAPWLAGHYEFQIRTLIYMIALVIIAIICAITIILLPVAMLIWLLLGIWMIIRVAIGLVRLVDGRPHPDPKSFFV